METTRLNKLITKLKDAQDNGYHFIYCEEHQPVPSAIEEDQFAKTGTEADKMAGNDGNTQLIDDWIKDLNNELSNQ